MKDNRKIADMVNRLGVNTLLEAGEYSYKGEGSSTVAFYLSLHYRTASLAMDVGRLLPHIRPNS